MQNTYLAIKDYCSNEIIINKSRFISYINRVKTESEAIDFINDIKKQHYNASHNCVAYIIGEHSMIQKAKDDGEPSGTAGVPMLEVLKKNGLSDTVCVVTRYFGGIKLGAGGLIRAYSQSVSEVIKKAGIIQRKIMQVIRITAEYSQIGIIDSRLTEYEIIKKDFLEKVYYEILVDVECIESFSEWFIDFTHHKIPFEKGDIRECWVDYKDK